MKTLRYILITCLLTLCVFSTISYTACKSDKCKDISCVNGNCYNGICTCNAGYEGVNCETDLCKNTTCENGGMCVSGICKCPAGYEGEHCEKINRFIGEYSAYDSCNTSGSNPPYVVAISMKGNGESAFKITNFANQQNIIYGSPSSSGYTFTFSGNNYQGYHVEGTAQYDEQTGNINVGYIIVYPTVNVSCTGTWIRQTP